MTIANWLELTVASGDVQRSRDAIFLVWDFRNAFPLSREEAADARVVVLADGSLARPRFGDVYFAASTPNSGGLPILHEKLESDPEVVDILRQLGVKDADGSVQPADLLPDLKSAANHQDGPERWRQFWHLLGSSGSDDETVDETFAVWHEIGFSLESVFIPNEVGEMARADSVLLSGPILGPTSAESDKRWLVSLELTRKLGRKLAEIRIWDRPQPAGGSMPWDSDYRDFLKEFPDLKTRGKLDRFLRDIPAFPSHLALLAQLTPEGSALLSRSYLAMLVDEAHELRPDERAKHPLIWALTQKGILPCVLGPRCSSQLLGHGLRDFMKVLPVADVGEIESGLLGLSVDISILGEEVLSEAIVRAAAESDPLLIGSLLALVSQVLSAPKVIPARQGGVTRDFHPAEVSVVIEQSDLDDHLEMQKPVVRVSSEESLANLVTNWGLRRSAVTGSIQRSSAEDVMSIADEFQGLIQYMDGVSCDEFRCCENLRRRITTDTGFRDSRIDSRLEENCVFLESADLSSSEDERDEQILRKIVSALKLQLNEAQIQGILQSRKSAEAREIERKCRDVAEHSNETGSDLSAEILATLFTLDELLKLLPSSLVNQIGEEKSDRRKVAKLALAVWGVEILSRSDAKEILRKNGHRVPQTFAGSRDARSFVRSIGLDSAFAGFPGLDREKHVEVSPKIEPVALHEYQQVVHAKMRQHYRTPPTDRSRGWRALLYMPTGAGKTRVTVQSIVDALNDGELRHPRVIWIAQSDELCEQAVQTFLEVWRSTGLGGLLSVERLWGSNEAVEEDFDDECAAQVVVCTYQKLAANIADDKWHPEYEWLKKSGLVVIDEAHGAAGLAFTEILAALGYGRGEQDRRKDPMPLLGLTATPKSRIRSRFGGITGIIGLDLPPGTTGFDYLRNLGVLSRVRHDEIDGMMIEPGETVPTAGHPWLIGEKYDQQLESNEERNKAIIDHICGQATHNDALILVFAASVAHSQILAALLVQRGVSAAAVSAETPRRLRHHYVKEFRKGNIKVLTNYGVLTQGFDNPKVNVVYVTRPVFSAAAYLQMVGRGLRGPLNGGTDDCLIVDINDNLEKFPDLKLVYEEVNEWLNHDGDGDLPDDIEDLDDTASSGDFE